MRSLLKVSAVLLVSMLVACGSQVVEFPVDEAQTTSTTPAPTYVQRPSTDIKASTTVMQLPSVDAGNDEDVAVTEDAAKETGHTDPCGGIECPGGQVCQQGKCFTPDPCAGVICPDGAHCTNGECVVQDPCVNVQCPDTQVCKNGACADRCAGVVCPEEKVCKLGACVCGGHDTNESHCEKGKTLVCHFPPGHLSNRHEVCVGDPAVKAHLCHGDKLGMCK